MATIARPNESVDSMIKRFKREVVKSEVLKELKKRSYYIPPSEKRRIKSAEAQKRARKNMPKQKMY